MPLRTAFRPRPDARRLLPWLMSLAFVSACDRCDDAPPPTYVFDDDAVIGDLSEPTSFGFTASGGVFVAEKQGTVQYFQGLDDRTPALVADLSEQVHSFYDRGLIAIRVHPDFPVMPSVYVLFAYDAPIGGMAPVFDDMDNREVDSTGSGRLVRLDLTATPVGDYVLASEHVLVHDWCQDFSSHSLADLAFGPDGMLYASAGEAASFLPAAGPDTGQLGNLCGDPEGEGGSLRAQDILTLDDPVGLDGTIIRVDPITGEGAPGNPFASSTDANARRIVAWGLRNPFRMTFRPGTSELWFGDVGMTSFEEVNRLVTPGVGMNFGWPCYEGPEAQSRFDGTAYCKTFTDRVQEGSLEVAMPYFAYRHNEPVTEATPCGGDGSSITGLAFNTGERYPARYAGGLFLMDFVRNCIFVLPRGDDGLPSTSVQLLATRAVHTPLDLQMGPDGYLYFASFGSGTLNRLTFGLPQADGGTQMMVDPRAPLPTIDAPAAETEVDAGERVTFSGHATDADGNPLPDAALSWKIQIFHCDEHASDACHIHTLTEIDGAAGSFRMLADHEYPSYVQLTLRAEAVEDGVAHVGEATLRVLYTSP